MFSHLYRSTCVLLALCALFLVATPGATLVALASAQEATPSIDDEVTITTEDVISVVTDTDGTVRFDVAEDATRFVFDPDLVFEDGMPAFGTTFITQGYIYPADTLGEGDGVLPDGRPAYPDLVIGEWTCRGWFVGDGAHSTRGVWLITTQLYRLGRESDPVLLISDGPESPEIGRPVTRALTGGTGPYISAGGEVTQTLLGYNESGGVNIRFEFDVTSSPG